LPIRLEVHRVVGVSSRKAVTDSVAVGIEAGDIRGLLPPLRF
jgi:hypothetical protein